MRDPQLTSAKATLRGWFAAQDDAYLTRVSDECRSGEFGYWRDCHCLLGLKDGGYLANRNNLEGRGAEAALIDLGGYRPAVTEPYEFYIRNTEQLRRVRTLPIALAEIRRRHRVLTAPPVEVACESEVTL